MQIKRLVSTLLVALPVLAGCRTDEKLNAPAVSDPMFRRYVAMGNSITAGFQSAGIDDSTQQRSYAQLLAKAMVTNFNYPQLNGRGCPPPFTNNITQTRVGGGTPTTCDLRVPRNGLMNSVAVPGARAEELLNNFGVPVSTSNALTTFFLGGKTQVERMTEMQPTFVSVWIGNNDVLGSLTNTSNPGDPLFVTPGAVFDAQYDSIAAAVSATGAKAVLIGVADVSVIPYASKGTFYFCASANAAGACGVPPQLPPGLFVSPSCAPALAGGLGDTTLVPWPIGVPKILAAAQGATDTLDCTVDTDVVSGSELAGLHAAVTGYNAHIQSVAAANGWAYLDPNPALLAARSDPTIPLKVEPFPSIPPNPLVAPVTFGTFFTLDGVHPSSLAHQVVASAIAAAINAQYSTTLPVPVCAAVSCPAP
jgi:lysophospholipase L1-like esterase